MLLSISLILMVGMFMGWLCQKCRLPSLLGMLATGMVLGPYVLNLLDGSILGISPELRKIALIIILTRAGLGLDTSGLKKLGRPAVLMCFVPASFELMGVLLLAPKLMGLTVLEAAILGAVLAAVSPAVVVPRMVRLMDEGYGGKQGIPQLILAGASVDDVYVIVLFSTFVGMMQGGKCLSAQFCQHPGVHSAGHGGGSGGGVPVGLLLCKGPYPGHRKGADHFEHLLPAGGSGGRPDHRYHLLGLDRHYVYRHRSAEKESGGGKKALGKIRQALGGCGGVPVCAGGRNGEHRLSGQGGRKGTAFDRGCAGISDAGRFCVPSGHEPEQKGAAFRHDGLHPQGNRAGCHWRHSAGTGLCLRRYGAYRGGAGHRADGSPWCLCHGSEL